MNEPSVFNGPEVSMPKDAKSIAGVEHREWHNLYGFYQQMATSRGLVERHEDQNERPFVLSRAYFAGSQRHGAMWTGDNEAKWSHLEIATPMLLTQGIAGFAFSGADVGGFFGNPSTELLVRWYQVAAYQPFFRAHAHLETKRREPWLFGDEILRLTRSAVLVRYALLPYLYTRFAESERTGMPIMRALWMHHPEDDEVVDMDHQFLCGEDLLVHPISTPDAKQVEVYLPHGTWYDVDDLTKHQGGHYVKIPVTLSKLPVFQRGGSVIPRKRRVRRSSEQMRKDPITLTIALDSSGEARGDLYQDDEHTFDYRTRNAFRRVEYVVSKESSRLNLKSRVVGGGEFVPQNVIERLEFVGLGFHPSRVYSGLSSSEKYEFKYDKKKDLLVVRKPGVVAAAPFHFVIEK
jgi:mannosyl-oligosaccharide alpha-1,3-glucosidase